MKYIDIVSMLTDIKMLYNVPFTYWSFPENEAPDLPYITFYYPSSSNYSADSSVYSRIDDLTIELYTKNKDFTLEGNVESVFNLYGLVWDKTEDYIESERMFMISYETEILINGE